LTFDGDGGTILDGTFDFSTREIVAATSQIIEQLGHLLFAVAFRHDDLELLEVDAVDLSAALLVGLGHLHLDVETTGAQNRLVERVQTVGGSHGQNQTVIAEALHLHQQLVERLLVLFVATALTARATLLCDSVDFVDEDDRDAAAT